MPEIDRYGMQPLSVSLSVGCEEVLGYSSKTDHRRVRMPIPLIESEVEESTEVVIFI